MNGVLKVLIDFVSEPSILVGIMVILGLVLQKKPVEDIIKGSIKAMVGFLVISSAAGVITGALGPFG